MSSDPHPTLLDRAFNKTQSAYPWLWDGLRGMWVPALGRTGLTLFDVSGQKNHGTLTNMVPADDWVVDSEMGRVLEFDGSNDLIVTPEIPIQPPITLVALLNQGDILRFGAVIATGNMSTGSNWGAMLQVRGTGAFAIYYGKGVAITTNARRMLISGNNLFVVDEWVMLVGVIHSLGNDMELFVNGESVSGTYNGTYAGSIGYDGSQGKLMHGNNNYVRGKLAFAATYNRALLPSEIRQLARDRLDPLRLRDTQIPIAGDVAVGNPWYYYAQQAAIIG